MEGWGLRFLRERAGRVVDGIFIVDGRLVDISEEGLRVLGNKVWDLNLPLASDTRSRTCQ